MHRPLAPLILAVLLPMATGQALAAPLDLNLPQGMTQTAETAETMASLALPKAPMAQGKIALHQHDAPLMRRAFRGPLQAGMAPHAVMADLRAQAVAAGYTVAFECESAHCGGFDFRYALNLLPEPDMHVDLGNFRYLHASKGEGDVLRVLTLVVSNSAQNAFVHITEIGADVLPAPRVVAATMSAPPPDAVVTGVARLLEGVDFASGQALVRDVQAAAMVELAQTLNNNPNLRATVIGHTDSSGKASANAALSLARAHAVRKALIQTHGIDAARLTAEGRGGAEPVASNDTAEGRAQNRRIEVLLRP